MASEGGAGGQGGDGGDGGEGGGAGFGSGVAGGSMTPNICRDAVVLPAPTSQPLGGDAVLAERQFMTGLLNDSEHLPRCRCATCADQPAPWRGRRVGRTPVHTAGTAGTDRPLEAAGASHAGTTRPAGSPAGPTNPAGTAGTAGTDRPLEAAGASHAGTTRPAGSPAGPTKIHSKVVGRVLDRPPSRGELRGCG